MRLWWILSLAAGVAAGSDDPISRMRSQVAERMARIPNYTCLETIERSWYASDYAGSLIRDRMRFEVSVVEGQEQFAWPGGGPLDVHERQIILGRGLTKTGDFAGFLSAIFAPYGTTYTRVGEEATGARRAIRYDYRVPQEGSRYTITQNGVTATVGFHGSFWADPETLDLTRVELNADNIPRSFMRRSAKIAIDYGLVAVGTGSFLLPRRTDASTVSNSKRENRTTTLFSECRQFLAESSITFEEKPVDQAVKQDDARVALPGGMILEAVLETPILRKTAATGDLVQAEVRKEVKAGDGVVVPQGAVLEGRIVLLEARGTQPADALAVRFTKVRFGTSEVGLRARLVGCGAAFQGAPGTQHGAWARYGYSISSGSMLFTGGFVELPKGLALTIETEAAAAR
ncbi:MAG TPA: hypothetical protein VN893_23570 [Bryobacteraceae bacterium]|nr:hypothetical protein [Bryobacteraceae bacterium]